MNLYRYKILIVVCAAFFSLTCGLSNGFTQEPTAAAKVMNAKISESKITHHETNTIPDTSVIESLRDDLIAYFPFNGDAQDASGNDFHGNVFGGTWIDSDQGQALSLDGNDYVITSLNMTDVWSVGDPIHLSVWIKTTENYGMALAGQPGGGPDFACVVADGRARVRLYGGVSVDSDVLVNDGAWHNVSWGTDGNATYFYVDGVVQSQAPTVGQFNREVAVMFGARMNPPIDFFQGSIDEIAIFDRALSRDEIEDLYKNGLVNKVYIPQIIRSGLCEYNFCDE